MSKASRNDPCPCGSGKKYKHCCLPADEQSAAASQAHRQAAEKSIPTLIAEGIRKHQAGQLADAQRIYREVLDLNPGDPDALHLLGVIARDTGNPDEAITLIRRAIDVLPGEASFHNNLGMAYRQLGRNEEAMASYDRAIALKPGHAEALNNLGNLCSQLEHFAKAVDCFERAIAVKPAFAEAHFNLGHVFQSMARLEEALGSYRRALAIRPDYVEALSNCGMSLHGLGRDEEALACLEQAISYQADFHPAYMNIGSISLNNGFAREALPFLQHAHQLSPQHADTLNILSHAEKDLGLIEAAIAHAHEAWRLAPASRPAIEAAVRLALLQYLRDDQAAAARFLALIADISPEQTSAPVRAYWNHLGLLLAWWKSPGDIGEKADRTLYAIGDSHALALQGLPVASKGRTYRGQALWIEGCKQWHLGNAEDNAYKSQFAAFLAGLPAGSPVLVSVGEIDCRPDEGILKVWRKHPSEPLAALIAKTIADFIAYIVPLRDAYQLDITLSGVPATNALREADDSASTRQFCELLQAFNQQLGEQAGQCGLGFLDLFALTDAGGGKADGRWHIDPIHLLPSAYAEAFRLSDTGNEAGRTT